MPYLQYNLPLHRTGFRPAGETNPWAATQLGAIHPQRQVFSEPGGRRLLAGLSAWGPRQVQRSFSPRLPGPHGPMSLMGFGQTTGDCSGPSGDFVACTDPSCSYGPCSAPAAPVQSACSDAGGSFVMCGDPGCKFGPCASVTCPPGQVNQGGYCVAPAGSSSGGGGGLLPGPAPRVNVPVTLFPATAPPTATPLPVGYQAPSVWNRSTIIAGVPDIAVVGIGAVLLMSLAGGGGYYAGRRR